MNIWIGLNLLVPLDVWKKSKILMDVYSIHAYEHRGRLSSKEARVAGSKPGLLI